MITPLVMLGVMTAPALFVLLRGVLTGRSSDLRPAAAIGLGLLFCFTASGHFAQTETMALMLPSWVPARIALVYLTGLLELVIALAFFVPGSRAAAGRGAMLLLIAFFPANIYAAFEHVPMGGHAWGPVYLLIRAPVQLLILAWVYRFTVQPPLLSPASDAEME